MFQFAFLCTKSVHPFEFAYVHDRLICTTNNLMLVVGLRACPAAGLNKTKYLNGRLYHEEELQLEAFILEEF